MDESIDIIRLFGYMMLMILKGFLYF